MFALQFQAGEIALFIPWRGWQPRKSGAALGWRRRRWRDAGAELPGRSRTRARSKLRRSLARSRSLSLGAGGSRGIWRGLGVAPAPVA